MEITNTKPDGTICGYLFRFNVIDRDNDVFVSGCFTKSLERLKDTGSYSVLQEDEQGLYFEMQAKPKDITFQYVWDNVAYDPSANVFVCKEINLLP